jgi:hypothetical protein
MAAGDESRKMLCNCGRLLAVFTRQGLELYCRSSKETVTVPYGIADLRRAIAFVEQRRAAGPGREPRI